MTKKKKEELRKQRRELSVSNRKHFIGALGRERRKHVIRTKKGLVTIMQVVTRVTVAVLLIIVFLSIVL